VAGADGEQRKARARRPHHRGITRTTRPASSTS
jgi:hypothetical protein